MGNICQNTITVVGMQDPPETFLRQLSKAMFDIDLDNPKIELWGDHNDEQGPQTWYRTLAEKYKKEGYAARYHILYLKNSYDRFGVSAPCFYVETKNSPPIAELLNASKAFPEKVFHVEWVILQDGPAGELVGQNGEVTENVQRCKSWYLFDNLCHPIASLLPAQMPFTLAQHAQLRFEDAIQALGDISQILDDPRFTHSPYQPLRDAPKTGEVQKTLQALQKQMRETSGMLDFEGVFLETFVPQSIRRDTLDATTMDISEENLSLDNVL